MSSIGNLTRFLSTAVMVVSLSVGCAFANTLSEIEINTQDSGYGIVFKTDSAVEMKKIVSNSDKMSIELKDVELSADFNTVYNNVVDIDNVTISPAAKNGVKVVFKGKDVANSKILIDTQNVSVLPTKVSSQSIELSAPISSYTPVYNADMFLEDEPIAQTSNPQLNEILSKMHISREMLVLAKSYTKKVFNKLGSSDINMMTLMGLILIVAVFVFRPAKKQKVLERSSLTSIASQVQNPNIDREMGINKKLVSNMDLRRSIPTNSSAVNSGYGVRAYQQSQKNPYTSTVPSQNGVSGIARRKPLASVAPIKKQTTINKPVASNAAVPIKSKAPSIVTPVTKKTKPVTNMQAEMDSMKFLESITKIYEKNGRADLAKGLQDNLKKAQMSQHIAV